MLIANPFNIPFQVRLVIEDQLDPTDLKVKSETPVAPDRLVCRVCAVCPVALVLPANLAALVSVARLVPTARTERMDRKVSKAFPDPWAHLVNVELP